MFSVSDARVSSESSESHFFVMRCRHEHAMNHAVGCAMTYLHGCAMVCLHEHTMVSLQDMLVQETMMKHVARVKLEEGHLSRVI